MRKFATALGVMLGLLVGIAAHADDTEIFYPQEIVQDDEVVRPNLLFLMDTSGSMADDDGSNKTRLQRMQDALSTLIDGLGHNVNVGLGRLSGEEGGAILFPVAPIDALVREVDGAQSSVALASKSASGGNEAQQLASTVSIAGAALSVGSSAAIPTGTRTTSFVIERLRNEAEQYSDNSVDTDNGSGVRSSDDIELRAVNDGTPNKTARYVGLRFEAFALPEGASVTSAKLEFTCKTGAQTGTTSAITIAAEAADNAIAFATGSNNVSNRTLALLTALWSPGNCNTAGDKLQSVDIKDVIAQVTSRSAWLNGNALSLRLTLPSTGATRIVSARSGGSADVAPKLVVTYSLPSAAQKARQFGLRFPAVKIPRGVHVTAASIRFLSAPGMDSTQTQQALTVTVGIQNNADAPAFTVADNDVSSRASASTISWSAAVMGSASGMVPTPDLSSLLNTLTAQSGWCGGQDVVFTFKQSAGSGLRAFLGGADANSSPILSYSYAQDDAALDSGCALKSVVRQVAAAGDNAEERVSNAAMSVNNNPLDLGYASTNRNLVGVRFENIDLPPGSVIRSARIDFTAQAADTVATSLTIRGHDAADAPGFTASAGDISARKTHQSTSATVSWTPGSWSNNNVYATPDLTAIVQEIVNRSDWASRHHLAFVFDTTASSGKRRAYSYGGSVARAPKLIIEAEAPAGRLTVREYLKQLVSDFQAEGYTPVPELMYEAAQYWRGGPAYFGRTRGDGYATLSDGDSLAPSAAMRISGSATFTAAPTVARDAQCSPLDPNSDACANERIEGSATYKSPLTEQECANNATVLLSDGQPNKTQASSISLIESLVGRSCAVTAGDDATGATCGAELASFLRNNDQSSALHGLQTVKTYTVGLQDLSSRSFLESVASAGGGQFYSASSTEEVLGAFQAIVTQVLDLPTTFVAPAVTVNTFNRLTNRSEIYFALFRPQSDARWEGNLKRYQLGGAPVEIRDVNDRGAVDSSTGFFKTTARSWWSAAVDGDQIAQGGVLDVFNTSRRFFTYTGTSSALDAGATTAPTVVSLTAAAHALNESNAAVTADLLGDAGMTTGERTEILQFSRGIDAYDDDGDGSSTDARHSLGDPLHSEPVLVTYGGSDASPDITLFFGTNEGALHAIDAATGAERFAFVPQELLPNLTTYARNTAGYRGRPYGVDGPITTVIKDSSDRHYASVQTGTQVLLYFGLRGGGRQYYALEVTDRSAPKLKFVMRGAGTGKYRELGYSWSRAVPARIQYNGAPRSVLIFSGGYDPKQDNETVPSNDGMGRALFIADADTGERLWWAGIDPDAGTDNPDLVMSQMSYSLPASPKAVDLNGDGLVDRIYAVDVAGQLFRFDLSASNTGGATLASGFRLARLSGDGTERNARRYYVTPDVALVQKNVSTPFLAISLGSGYRGHPLNKNTLDRFYVLRDADIRVGQQGSAALAAISDAALYNATANAIASSDATTANAARSALDASRGFYIELANGDGTLAGEKVMTDAQTFDNQVLFASYLPGARAAGQACQASSGLSRFYLFSVADGRPTQALSAAPNTTPPATLTTADRYKTLAQGGLPPSPKILFPAVNAVLPNEALVCIGPECLRPGLSITTEKTYWIRRR